VKTKKILPFKQLNVHKEQITIWNWFRYQ